MNWDNPIRPYFLCNQTVLNKHNLTLHWCGGGGQIMSTILLPPTPHGVFRSSYGPEREWQAYDEDVLKGL